MRKTNFLDRWLNRYSKNILTKLTDTDLANREKIIIDESKIKYVNSKRESIWYALLCAPAMMTQEPAIALAMLGPIITVTGVAWFQITLKDVKERHIDFGLEMTENVLKSFLTSLYVVFAYTGYQLFSQDLSALYQWILAQSLPDIQALSWQLGLITIKLIGYLTLISKIMNRVETGVMQFDATDAMLTGAGDVANRFYQGSLNEVKNIGESFRSGTTRDLHGSTNGRIVKGISTYIAFLKRTNANLIPASFVSTSDLLRRVADNAQDFDQYFVPMLVHFIKDYEDFIEDLELKEESKFCIKALHLIIEDDQTKDIETRRQPFKDLGYGESFSLLAKLMQEYQDQLQSLKRKTKKNTPS